MLNSLLDRTRRSPLGTAALCAACTTAIAAAATAPAQADEEEAHVDAFLYVDSDGRLTTGGYDFEGTAISTLNTRVYEAEFDEFGTTDEPGFNAVPQSGLPAGSTALPANTPVTFNAVGIDLGTSQSNLLHWNGTGVVDFAPVTGDTNLVIRKPQGLSFASITLDGSDADVAGFEIDTTNGSGFLHRHIDFIINDGDFLPDLVDDGFYLFALELSVGAGLVSEPTYFVHGFGNHTEEAHEAAVAFVESTLVPEPASAAVFGLAGLALLRRRRQA